MYHYPWFRSYSVFSIQQFSEGMIWINMTTANVHLLYSSALLYMFFAFLLWPAYFPFCLYFIETISMRRKILFGLIILGLILGVIIYIPLLMHDVDFNLKRINQSLAHSIQLTVYSQHFYTLSYALIIFISALVCSKNEIKKFGLLVMISFLLAMFWFLYAFISVWCYFAAFLSLYIVYIVSSLPLLSVTHGD